MKIKRKIIEINQDLCDGCGQCVSACSEGAIQIVDGKARLVEEKYCDGLGACLGECPTGALRVIEREAEDFDFEAVEEYLNQKDKDKEETPSLACGCPATQVESFHRPCSNHSTGSSTEVTAIESALSHWPIKIKLVPPTAAFLKGADLLVLADCTAVAYPNLHRDFLINKVVLMGCPKFDQIEEYLQKFSAIFQATEIKSLTVLMMEVPCCSGLAAILEKALVLAGKKIPIEKIRVSTRGNRLIGEP